MTKPFDFMLYNIQLCNCWELRTKTTHVVNDNVEKFREAGCTLMKQTFLQLNVRHRNCN